VSDVVADSLVVEMARKGRSPRGEAGAKAWSRDSSSSRASEEGLFDDEGVGAGEGGLDGALQSLCWACSAVGSVLSAYSSGALLESVGPRTVFTGAAAFPLLVAAISFAIAEERVAPNLQGSNLRGLRSNPATANPSGEGAAAPDTPLLGLAAEDPALSPGSPEAADPDGLVGDLGERGAQLWETVTQKSVWVPAAFLFAWKATPTADQAFFYYLTGPLDFQPEFLGRVSLAGACASLAGVLAYNRWLRAVPCDEVLKWTTLAGLPPALLQLALVTHANRAWGLSDELFALGDDVVLSVLGQIGFMPTLVLAARLCPPGAEGTLFALLMSLYNGAGIVGQEGGALLTSALGVSDSNFDNLAPLLAACALSSLLPLPFLGLLKDAEGGGGGGAGVAETSGTEAALEAE